MRNRSGCRLATQTKSTRSLARPSLWIFGAYDRSKGRTMIRPYRYLAALACMMAGIGLASAQQQSATPVGTVAAEIRPITRATDFVGRVEAPEKVEVRARITGYLQDVLFKEGDIV